ncbi:hypothetical protein TYRP_011830 [Tyrophagus putrescentiae]|nr:hypothetical protein TYRP_011830 [Tyrophagus putrescentiae]
MPFSPPSCSIFIFTTACSIGKTSPFFPASALKLLTNSLIFSSWQRKSSGLQLHRLHRQLHAKVGQQERVDRFDAPHKVDHLGEVDIWLEAGRSEELRLDVLRLALFNEKLVGQQLADLHRQVDLLPTTFSRPSSVNVRPGAHQRKGVDRDSKSILVVLLHGGLNAVHAELVLVGSLEAKSVHSVRHLAPPVGGLHLQAAHQLAGSADLARRKIVQWFRFQKAAHQLLKGGQVGGEDCGALVMKVKGEANLRQADRGAEAGHRVEGAVAAQGASAPGRRQVVEVSLVGGEAAARLDQAAHQLLVDGQHPRADLGGALGRGRGRLFAGAATAATPLLFIFIETLHLAEVNGGDEGEADGEAVRASLRQRYLLHLGQEFELEPGGAVQRLDAVVDDAKADEHPLLDRAVDLEEVAHQLDGVALQSAAHCLATQLLVTFRFRHGQIARIGALVLALVAPTTASKTTTTSTATRIILSDHSVATITTTRRRRGYCTLLVLVIATLEIALTTAPAPASATTSVVAPAATSTAIICKK